jgi:hypothetical protein
MLISGSFSDIIFLKVYVEWYRVVHEFVLASYHYPIPIKLISSDAIIGYSIAFV